MMNHVRWCVNVTRWRPTKEEWLKLTSSIASDELDRINKFVFQDDSKSSLIGCALIRKFLSDATSTPSNDIDITRTERGRPVLSEDYRLSRDESWPSMIDFNVSHSGDYCVLAGVFSRAKRPSIRVGIDVHKIVRKETDYELDRFFDLMSRRQFTPAEWQAVDKVKCYEQKCINFTHLNQFK